METITPTTPSTKDNTRLLRYHLNRTDSSNNPVFHQDHQDLYNRLKNYEFSSFEEYVKACKSTGIDYYNFDCFNDYLQTKPN